MQRDLTAVRAAMLHAHDVLHNARAMLPESDAGHAEIGEAMRGLREAAALASAPAAPDAHALWAAAQLVPGEGIEDGVARIEALLGAASAPAARPKADMLVNGGALQMALNILKRGTAVQQEAAAELEKTARPAAPDFDPQAQRAAAPQCTCHPDDSPPVPCAKMYALQDCRAASEPDEARKALDFLAGLHGNLTIGADQPMKMADAIFEHVQSEMRHYRDDAERCRAELVSLAAERREMARWKLAQAPGGAA